MQKKVHFAALFYFFPLLSPFSFPIHFPSFSPPFLRCRWQGVYFAVQRYYFFLNGARGWLILSENPARYANPEAYILILRYL